MTHTVTGARAEGTLAVWMARQIAVLLWQRANTRSELSSSDKRLRRQRKRRERNEKINKSGVMEFFLFSVLALTKTQTRLRFAVQALVHRLLPKAVFITLLSELEGNSMISGVELHSSLGQQSYPISATQYKERFILFYFCLYGGIFNQDFQTFL